MDSNLYDRVMQVIDHLRGGSQDIISGFDEAVEEGLISQEEWDKHEMSILDIADNHIFTCVGCNWTLNVDEMGEDTDGGEIQCTNCAGED